VALRGLTGGYDRYPYPPPQDNLEAYRQLWSDPQRRRTEIPPVLALETIPRDLLESHRRLRDVPGCRPLWRR